MSKRKKGHVAIPFLIAFLLGIVCIGGAALVITHQLSDKDEIKQMQTTVHKPTAEHNVTILFVLDEPADPCPQTFLVARLLPAKKQIMVVSMPANMLAVVNGKQNTLAGFYKEGGVQNAKAALLNEAGIAVDRYMVMDSAGFQKIADIFAGVYYLVPPGTGGFTDSQEPQYLGASQMEKLITYPLFEQGESQRSVVVSDVICEMLNQTDYSRIIPSMDSDFKILVNMVDTDISSIDYDTEKDALKYMFKYGTEMAFFRIATGMDNQTDAFILNDTFKSTIAEFFTEEITETVSGTTAE